MAASIPYVKLQFAITGLFGMTGVAADAYGSHGLKNKVPVDRQQLFLTGARYQLMHSCIMAAAVALKVALLASGVRSRSSPAIRCLNMSWGLFVLGTLGFSCNLYWQVVAGPNDFSWVTPWGGSALMGGWAFLTATALCL